MLSKLRYFTKYCASDLSRFRERVDVSPVLQRLGGRAVDFRRVEGGTMGVGFLAQINGSCRFLKTHIVPEGRGSLDKEAAILSCLYGPAIHIERMEVSDGGACRLWLVMDKLVEPEVEFSPVQILGLIDDLSHRLENCDGIVRIYSNDNFALLLRAGNEALRNLARYGLLSDYVQEEIRYRFALLEENLDQFFPCVCHGDFSQNNLMSTGIEPVVIDWEDAFWGIEGYDYLYWLTFFCNRRYYSQDIFGKTPWGKQVDIAILVLIIVIKSDISFYADSHLDNSLTFDQRLLEVLALS